MDHVNTQVRHLFRAWLAGVALIVALPCIGGSPPAVETAYRPSRLEDGRADLQGIWVMSNLTPLERWPEFKTLVISPEEARHLEARIRQLRDNPAIPAEPSQFDEERQVEPTRGELRSSIIVEPRDGVIPGNALFKEQAAWFRANTLTVADGPEQRPPPERCLSSPGTTPPMQSIVSLNLHQIVQTPDTIVIQSEWNRDARFIRMNAQHAPAAITSWLGDSIGWWDGDTLVVETRYFAPSSHTRASALVLFFVSPQTVVTERFTLVSSQELEYVFTVVDETYYTSAWKGETHLRRAAGPIFEYACHEGNYSLTGILQGARAVEARQAVR